MRRTIPTFVLAGALALGGLPALAADPLPEQPTVQAQKERLESGRRAVDARYAGAQKGVLQAERARQLRAIDGLIRRLEAGENVAPSEVDRVLQAR